MKPKLFCGLLSMILLGLVSCTSPSEVAAKKAEATPDPPLTGRQAFQRIFPQARVWAPDGMPVLLQSFNLPQVKSENGKAGAWQATFVSASRQRSRIFNWSAIEKGDLHKGVFPAPEQSASSTSAQDSVFLIAAIRTDSDQAWEVALQQKDTAAFRTKFPNTPVTFVLEKTRRFPDLTWRVIFGESASTSEYSVYVDATTGKYLERTR